QSVELSHIPLCIQDTGLLLGLGTLDQGLCFPARCRNAFVPILIRFVDLRVLLFPSVRYLSESRSNLAWRRLDILEFQVVDQDPCLILAQRLDEKLLRLCLDDRFTFCDREV